MCEIKNVSDNYTEEYIQNYLSMLQHKSTISFIPTFVYLCLLILTGTVGNSLVIIVYYKKLTRTPLKILIINMAIFDLLIDITVIPSEIYDLLHVWNFDHPIICKLKRYLGSACLTCSSFVLVAIAATRYRMVCCSAEKQITIIHAKIICVAIVCISLFSSIVYCYIHGSQTRRTPNPSIIGHFCQVDDSYVSTFLPILNSAIYILIFFACITAMAFFYIKIGSKVWKHKITHAENQRTIGDGSVTDSTSAGNLSVTSSPTVNRKQSCNTLDGRLPPSFHGSLRRTAQLNEKCFNVQFNNKTQTIVPNWTSQSAQPSNLTNRGIEKRNGLILNENSLKNKKEITQKYKNSLKLSYNRRVNPDNSLSGSWTILTALGSSDSSQPEKRVAKQTPSFSSTVQRKRLSVFSRTSWMMFTISVVSIIGYCPFLALHLYKDVAPEHYAELKGFQLAMYHLFYRSYLSNSALNPIVYSIMNKKFRKECGRFFVRSG